MPHILTVNGGSSSIKFALFDNALARVLSGQFSRIGLQGTEMEITVPSKKNKCPPKSRCCARFRNANLPLLQEPLERKHIKPRLLGHWGTTPGLNFIYVHLNRVIVQRDLDMIYICGPGHGGPGIVANTYLEGTYSEWTARNRMKKSRHTMARIEISADTAGLYRAAANEFVRQANASVRERGIFHVALSGGSTPKGLYALLANDDALRQAVPWTEIHFWWSDERHVPPEHPESNFKLAQDALLTHLPISPENIHRVRAEEPNAELAARRYENEMREIFKVNVPEIPTFDLVLLGMGPDGHTASLFPGTRALNETTQLVAANWVGKLYTWRITFTAPLINQARAVLLLVAGSDKALALKGVLEGPIEPLQLPVQLIQPASGNLTWLLDAAAGAELSRYTNA